MATVVNHRVSLACGKDYTTTIAASCKFQPRASFFSCESQTLFDHASPTPRNNSLLSDCHFRLCLCLCTVLLLLARPAKRGQRCQSRRRRGVAPLGGLGGLDNAADGRQAEGDPSISRSKQHSPPPRCRKIFALVLMTYTAALPGILSIAFLPYKSRTWSAPGLGEPAIACLNRDFSFFRWVSAL